VEDVVLVLEQPEQLGVFHLLDLEEAPHRQVTMLA
jgi:hypothetical protein